MSVESIKQGQPAAMNMQNSLTTTAEGFPSSRQMNWIVFALLIYFGLRLLFFAICIAPAVPPDEETHFGISRVFSNVPFFPVNSLETYQYGLVTNIPWLYYWIMGKLLVLNISGISDVIFLRLLNIPLAFGTVYYAWRTLRLMTDDRLAQILLIVVMTNTLMFSFLSASVSYDNLTNLFAVMSLFYLLAFFKNSSGNLLALSLLCQLSGCLTKFSLLPLILALNILLLIHEFRNLRALPSALASWFRASGRQALVLTLAILLGLALNLSLYGGNYMHFGKLAPGMAEVLSPGIAMQNRLHARNMIFTQFREGKISAESAVAMTAIISHPVDRASAVALIKGYEYRIKIGYRVLGQLAYAPKWIRAMLHGIYGIFANLPAPQSSIRISLFCLLFLLAGLSFMFRCRPRKAGLTPVYLAIIASFYGLFIMYSLNYREYVDSRIIWLSLQGRYIFPVMGPFYVLLSYYLMHLFTGRRAQMGIFTLAVLIFMVSDFPFFLSFATSDWFAWTLN